MNWLVVDKVSIFTGKDENGNRYLNQFLKEYQETFNPDMINAGCQRCLEDYYLKFTKYLQSMSQPKTLSAYKLKEKYNGIPLEFGSQIQVSNSNMTDAYAEQLLKSHPKGADLFETLPEVSEESSNKASNEAADLLSLTRKQLNAKAADLGLDPKSYSNKQEVANAITELQNSDLSEEE